MPLLLLLLLLLHHAPHGLTDVTFAITITGRFGSQTSMHVSGSPMP
jgi:hypothetical protein